MCLGLGFFSFINYQHTNTEYYRDDALINKIKESVGDQLTTQEIITIFDNFILLQS